MSQSREMIPPVCARGSRGACSRGAARLVNGDGRRVEERESRQQTPPNPRSIEEGVRGLVHQLRGFLVALWLSPGRRGLALLIIGTVFVIGATAAAQVGLNAWNRPFYQAIAERNFPAFLDQLLVFTVIAGCLLVLNVAQAWLREMIKLKSREWLTRDLFGEWLKPGRSIRLARAGEVGINPDQRIHEDARRLTELSADLGIGLLQASLLLLSFLGVLWTVSGALDICGVSLTVPGYMVWCALLYAASGSWLTWRVGRPLVGMNSRRYQRESEFRFALFQANQQIQNIASRRGEEREYRRLGLDLEKVLGMVREIVDATARLTWITAGYGWISIVAPIAIASPAYFTGRLSFGELMVVVGGFNQVNQSLRWFVDNFALLADWRAALSRVIKFREALLRSENGYEQENRAPHLRDFAITRLHYGAASKGKKAVLDAVSRMWREVARGRDVSGSRPAPRHCRSAGDWRRDLRCIWCSAPLSTNQPRSRSGNARSCMRIATYAVDLHERLIQMPPPLRIAAHVRDPPFSDLSGEHRAESVPPKPDRLMADVDPALG
jgi:ABC-type long-subunit fatty acid transport system fused permease/ATPase subunit